MTGIELIQQERMRQQEVEGWSCEHDYQHVNGELKSAALCYWGYGNLWNDEDIADMWPWEKSSWKPSENIVKNLVRAGALYSAENDRTGTKDCDIQINMLARRIDYHLKYDKAQDK